MKIVGYTVGTSLPKPDFNQNDPKKGDYIKNKPDFVCFNTDIEIPEGSAPSLDADSLGGIPASSYMTSDEAEANYVKASIEEVVMGEMAMSVADKAKEATHAVSADEATHANEADRALETDNSLKLGGKDPKYYTPYTNLADNSDFEHWVAQVGIGGKHGTETYGGDRWILVDGSISGSASADGLGYSNVTLNGTLVQVVASPPSVATAFVEMVSGEASIVYDVNKGEIIITSSGGVIKNVMLLPGEWPEKPQYSAKGYAAELLECKLYLQEMKSGNVTGTALTYAENKATIYIPSSIRMRTLPTISYNYVANSRRLLVVSQYGVADVTGLTIHAFFENTIIMSATTNKALENTKPAILGSAGAPTIVFIADLPRR